MYLCHLLLSHLDLFPSSLSSLLFFSFWGPVVSPSFFPLVTDRSLTTTVFCSVGTFVFLYEAAGPSSLPSPWSIFLSFPDAGISKRNVETAGRWWRVCGLYSEIGIVFQSNVGGQRCKSFAGPLAMPRTHQSIIFHSLPGCLTYCLFSLSLRVLLSLLFLLPCLPLYLSGCFIESRLSKGWVPFNCISCFHPFSFIHFISVDGRRVLVHPSSNSRPVVKAGRRFWSSLLFMCRYDRYLMFPSLLFWRCCLTCPTSTCVSHYLCLSLSPSLSLFFD